MDYQTFIITMHDRMKAEMQPEAEVEVYRAVKNNGIFKFFSAVWRCKYHSAVGIHHHGKNIIFKTGDHEILHFFGR